MNEDTQVTRPSYRAGSRSSQQNVDLADTQPMRLVPRPPQAAVMPANTSTGGSRRGRRRRGCSCLPTLILAVLCTVAVLGALALTAYAALMWTVPQSRVNILILGIDRRPDQGYVVRTDTIVLATIDSRGPSVGLLSIPRDLYVDIPGYGANRINTAHFWGESESAGYGPGLAMATIGTNFEIPVHHYLRIDFDGFRAIIDAAGDIDIMVEEAIMDDAYPTSDYGVVHIEIPKGLQHMDGETALRYARSRHGSSDFSRAKRQQQIVIALAERLIEPQNWLKLPAVYQAFAENVDTDLTIVQMLSLSPTVLHVGPEGIAHRVIDQDMTQPWTTPTGGAVLLPQWELINPVVQELFGP